MDALREARNYLDQYQNRINQDSFCGDLESRTRYENAAYQEGMLSAAIAQAEQLARIGDALDRWMSVQGVLPEFFEAVDRAKRTQAENAQLYQRIAELEGEHDDDDDREAIQPGDYRYFTGVSKPRELPF